MNEGMRIQSGKTEEGPSTPPGPHQLPIELQPYRTPVLYLPRIITQTIEWITAMPVAAPVCHINADWLTSKELETLTDIVWGAGGLPENKPELLDAHADTRLAMCLSGGLRAVATGMVLFKRFIFDVYPQTKVFLLTWRDPNQNYSDAAFAFVKEFLADRIAVCQFFEDDIAAVENETERVAIANKIQGHPDSSRFPFVTQMWVRRKYCNDMRKKWTMENDYPFQYIFRARFDGFIFQTPVHTAVTPIRCLASVDLSLMGTPDQADAECSLGDTYPSLHEEAYRIGGRTWEFGSELHVELAIQGAGFQLQKTPYYGRFGRWRRSNDHVAPHPCECKALHTLAE